MDKKKFRRCLAAQTPHSPIDPPLEIFSAYIHVVLTSQDHFGSLTVKAVLEDPGWCIRMIYVNINLITNQSGDGVSSSRPGLQL